jgi:hypothetical protein
MEVVMNHPVIASANAETRYNEFLVEAKNYRQRKRLPGNIYALPRFLTGFIRILLRLLNKSKGMVTSDEMELV